MIQKMKGVQKKGNFLTNEKTFDLSIGTMASAEATFSGCSIQTLCGMAFSRSEFDRACNSASEESFLTTVLISKPRLR